MILPPAFVLIPTCPLKSLPIANLYLLVSELHPTTGFAVALEDYELKLDLGVLNNSNLLRDHVSREIEAYVEKHASILGDRRNHIGAWMPKTANGSCLYLDVTRVIQDPKTAMQLGRKHAQEAIYDLSKPGPGGTIKLA